MPALKRAGRRPRQRYGAHARRDWQRPHLGRAAAPCGRRCDARTDHAGRHRQRTATVHRNRPVLQRLDAICVADPDPHPGRHRLVVRRTDPCRHRRVPRRRCDRYPRQPQLVGPAGSATAPAPSNRRPALPPSSRPRVWPPRASPRPRRAPPMPSPARPPTPPCRRERRRALSRWSPATARRQRTCAVRSSSSAMRFRCASRRRRPNRRSTARSSIRRRSPRSSRIRRSPRASRRRSESAARTCARISTGRYPRPGRAPARRRCRR